MAKVFKICTYFGLVMAPQGTYPKDIISVCKNVFAACIIMKKEEKLNVKNRSVLSIVIHPYNGRLIKKIML